MIPQFEFPALYATANRISNNSQFFFLLLVRAEYLLLFGAAVASMNFYVAPIYFIIPAVLLICSLVILVVRSLSKPEQQWYQGRALAESIKTSCWKYCMRGEPFGDSDSLPKRRAEFRQYLVEILHANKFIGDRTPADDSAGDQITTSMENARTLSLEERIKYYDTRRIREQRLWYAKRASANKKASKYWVAVGVIAYGIAIVLSLLRITKPDFPFWPIEPIIVVASSILGWAQIKKFNELASSYALTAHEIGILQAKIIEIKTENEFSQFVIEAEQAFSREHTQWVARQHQA
ncbi:DUF4231 domain-containing protein [Rhizobium leguminosarum]